MKKSIGVFLYGVSCLLSSVYATPNNEHYLTLGPSMEFTLPPNQPQYFLNPMMWTVKANCTLTSADPLIQLTFTVLRKSGTVNDITFNVGDSMSMSFLPNDQVAISAVSGGKVELLNQGETTVTASCYTL
jgi:hypothetical protein